jgi:hypothetical protein
LLKTFAQAAEFQIVRKQYAALRDRKFKDDFISRAGPLLQYVNLTCGASFGDEDRIAVLVSQDEHHSAARTIRSSANRAAA